jgi:cAMP-dependent protein kinase regulator
VKDAASKKRERYDDFLQSIKILKTMDPYERSKLSDALSE